MKVVPIVVILFSYLFLFPPQASACSCIASKPICQSYWEADAVFVGTVTRMEPLGRSLGPIRSVGGFDVQFALHEAFRGAQGEAATIWTGGGGGDCGYPFEIGREYLVFAYKDEKLGRLETGICSRTTLAYRAEAQLDLKYIRSLKTVRQVAKIFGTLELYPSLELDDGFSGDPELLVGIHVDARAKGKMLSVITNGSGRFEINEVPPGKYRVQPRLPPTLMNEAVEVDLAAGACAEINFRTKIDGRIRGRVLGSDGRPVSMVLVTLIRAEDDPATDPNSLWEFTEEDGSYELKGIPPGRYVIGINITEPPSPKAPFPRTFYKSATNREQAQILELKKGEKRRQVDLTLFPQLKDRDLEVSVVWSDGTPASGAYVYLHDPTYPEQEIVGDAVSRTAENGRFVLKRLGDADYWVQAYASKGYRADVCAMPVFVPSDKEIAELRIVLVVQSEYCTYDYFPKARKRASTSLSEPSPGPRNQPF